MTEVNPVHLLKAELPIEIKELGRKIPKNTAKIEEQEKLVEGLRASWIKESQMDLSDDHCPYCQQELPPAMLEKMVQEFNIEKSNRLEAITTEAEKLQEETVELQQELVDTEDKIQASRRFYNGGVRDLNTKIQTFPSNIVAGMFGFKNRDFFELDEAEQKVAEKPVEVKF